MKKCQTASSLLSFTCVAAIFVWLALYLPFSYAQEETSVPVVVYTGPAGLGCTNGSCNFTGVCNELAVPGTDQGNSFYNDINGEVFLNPETCQATCDDGCIRIAQADPDCIGSAGYVFCPETENCIRPWEENCPFEGSIITGPTKLICVNGRCNNLADTCDVVFGSATLGGPYIAGLNGEYELSAGCSATCAGCTAESSAAKPLPVWSVMSGLWARCAFALIIVVQFL